MADLSTNCAGIRSPNPFWLASAPPANSGEQIMRAFDAGWGGAVWKTLGTPIQNVSSRFAALNSGNRRAVGFNNIELITDRPLLVHGIGSLCLDLKIQRAFQKIVYPLNPQKLLSTILIQNHL